MDVNNFTQVKFIILKLWDDFIRDTGAQEDKKKERKAIFE